MCLAYNVLFEVHSKREMVENLRSNLLEELPLGLFRNPIHGHWVRNGVKKFSRIIEQPVQASGLLANGISKAAGMIVLLVFKISRRS